MPTNPADNDSIIDVTGIFLRLEAAIKQLEPANAAPTPPSAPLYHYYDYEPPSLGKIYKEKLGLTARQVSWVNRFPLPANAFLEIEAGRTATVQLYVTVLPLLEQQFKAEGSTLAQTVNGLTDRAKFFRYQAATAWYYGSPPSSKTGADIYLAIFRVCENAVRARLGHKRKMANVFTGGLAGLKPEFQEVLGQRVQMLLPALVAQLPPPDHETELLLNEQNTSRWKAELELLLTRLPPHAPAFGTALTELVRRNARNPAAGALYQEATRQLTASHREEALRYHLRYLHSMQARFAEGKALAKGLQKQLFPLPGQTERFQIIVNELAFYQKLDDALAKVPTVYVVPRKKIELDSRAIHAVRNQHADTVELLNEYLRDEPAPAMPAAAQALNAKPAPHPTLPARPKKASSRPVKVPAPTSRFATSLVLSAPQQALLLRFAERALALPQAEVETFAKTYGALRNQLIDSLNEACYELLDDVLIEESGDDYTIYEVYYQRLTSC